MARGSGLPTAAGGADRRSTISRPTRSAELRAAATRSGASPEAALGEGVGRPAADARQRWAEAELADPETPFMAYQAPPLPAWSAKAPAHVTRELLGRLLQDRDTRIVHDVYQATPECAVDAIRNGTFFHFWSEVLADHSVADDRPCAHCMAPPILPGDRP
jgi:hypothetical protein